MINKKIFLFSLLFLFLLVGFASSQGCADEGWKGYGIIHQNKTVTITCSTCEYINLTVVNADGNIFLDNVGMTGNNTFYYTFLGDNLNKVGTYQVDGYSQLDTPISFCFDVSMNGRPPSIGVYTMLILLSIGFFIFVIWMNIKFNEERRNKLYNKIVAGYFNNKTNGDRNLGTTILYTLGYGLFKNFIMFYYLAIVFFMFVLTELVESFGISSFILLFTTLLYVVLWGFILVFIYMIFSFYELIMTLIKDVTDSYRGLWNGK